MADIIKQQDEQLPGTMKTRYKDMGDETHAEVIYAGDRAGETIVMHQSRVDVATTSTAVIAPNNSRAYLLLINDDDQVIYLSFGGAAQLYAGVRLNGGGGSYEMGHAFGNNFTGPVYAVHGGTGTKRLLVNEGV